MPVSHACAQAAGVRLPDSELLFCRFCTELSESEGVRRGALYAQPKYFSYWACLWLGVTLKVDMPYGDMNTKTCYIHRTLFHNQ